MTMPSIKYYARFEDVTGNGKTPKYQIVHEAGYYPEMETMKGRDGKISVYLIPSKDSGSNKDNAPAMKLQGKNSLNFTGLKDYFVDGGKLSGVAYGYPFDKPTYGKAGKPNPFYECKDDCFLFVVHHTKEDLRPSGFEMLVIEKGKVLAPIYCKSLLMGGFEDVLSKLRSIKELSL